MPISSKRRPTIKHRYPKKSKIRISISRLICHLLPVLGLRTKTVFPSIAFAVISSPVKIPDKKSPRSVHYGTSGGNPLAKRKQRTRELPGRPRSNISFQNSGLTTGAEYKCLEPKTSSFLFFRLSLPMNPRAEQHFTEKSINCFKTKPENLAD